LNQKISSTQLDAQDPLNHFKSRFHFPKYGSKNTIYFCGNSLGLQPKTVKKFLLEELKQWEKFGVEGHFEGERPWKDYHKFLTPFIAKIVGAKNDEVVVMNTLTTNLHLLMASFYKPEGKRTKILMEAGAFPSDQYAMETQAKWHGLDPAENVVELQPRAGEFTLRKEDILSKIEELDDSLALVMMGGVNYYTGQFFPLEEITKAGHKVGALVGFDLAHAAGNVELQLHDWKVDFACWCSYKYLNSGPGGPAGIFVHEKHGNNPNILRLAGWWGHYEEERFLMKKGFIPMKGAQSWQQSNAQVLAFAAHLASLEIFDEAGIKNLREKSVKLTEYLHSKLRAIANSDSKFSIITPKNANERGAQLSILVSQNGKKIFDILTENGVIADWREPNVIRIAPAPLYCGYKDCDRFVKIFEMAILG
jgi:kynureninase